MNSELKCLLDWLSEKLDTDRLDSIAARYRRSLAFEQVDRPPLVFTYPYPESAEFQPYPHREIFDDPEKMLYNELVHAFGMSIVMNHEIGADLPWTVRANFGTVLIASMFGAEVEQNADNPPWVRPDCERKITPREVADTDPKDFSQGWIERAARTMQAYQQLLQPFPELRQKLIITLPDLQGPLDNLDLICGSELFLYLHTMPKEVESALSNLATAQIELYKHFSQWTTEPATGYCHQHGVMLKGNILIRNDSAIMVSPEMYRGQIAPHDERVLLECGGGGMHACGKCDHLTDIFLSLPSIKSLDLGQPELNQIDLIHQRARDKKVPLIRSKVTPE